MMKRIISLILALAMMMSCTIASAETIKNERVFAVLNAKGETETLIDSVSLENRDGLDELNDRSMLKDIENVGGNGTFRVDGENLIWQTDGRDVTYQGRSEKALPVKPVVTVLLNGSEIEPQALTKSTGTVELNVHYEQQAEVPHLAATLILLPETGATVVELENAEMVSFSGRQAVIGWGVPGMDKSLGLPDSFTVRLNADQADIGWMMTFASADPIDMICREADQLVDFDIRVEQDEVVQLLSALRDGKSLPETTGKTKGISDRVNELNDGLDKLNKGAKTLSDGVSVLSESMETLADKIKLLASGTGSLQEGSVRLVEGANSLSEGLSTLSANSGTLNDGADGIFEALLNSASRQLSISGLEEAGITVPQLTEQNYEEVLTGIMEQLNPDAMAVNVRQQTEAAVRQEVMAKRHEIREAVSQEVRKTVLEKVLENAGLKMDADTFMAAAESEKVEAAQSEQILATVEAQMSSEEIQNKINEAVTDQTEKMIQENVERILETDETVKARITEAETARSSIESLLEQLKQVQSFVEGVRTYTAGVDTAASGASELANGANDLKNGADELNSGAEKLNSGVITMNLGMKKLSSGAKKLHDEGTDLLQNRIMEAEREMAAKLLPLADEELNEAIRIYETTRDNAANSGYDLRPDDMQTITVYIMRTDLN